MVLKKFRNKKEVALSVKDGIGINDIKSGANTINEKQ